MAAAKTPFLKPSEKFRGVQGVREYSAGMASIWNDSAQVVEDAEAEGGYAAKLALPAEAGKYALPMLCGLYSSARAKGISSCSLKAPQVPAAGYHWYKLFTAVPESTAYVYFFWSWVIQYPLGISQGGDGEAYTFWAKIKFTGSAFPHARAGEPNAIFIERLALEKAAPAGPPAVKKP